MRYYIGVDGGGTKTAVCAVCVDDYTMRYTKTSGSSWREHGVTKVAQSLKKCIEKLVGEDFTQIAGIAMGLPCHGESIDGDHALEDAIRKVFVDIPIYFTNDVEVGWAGSIALEPGINVVAGTGSIAFGKDSSGTTARSGGWSEFFSDEGSCYWLGRKVMEIFSKQSDGRCPKDALYEIVRSEFGLKNDFGFIDLAYEYSGYRERVASLQFLVEKAAKVGAPSAIKLYEEAVDELYLLVDAVRSQLDFASKPWVVSYSGGLFKAGELVIPQFSAKIAADGGKLVQPEFEPVQGAVLLALEHFAPEHLEKVQATMKKEQR